MRTTTPVGVPDSLKEVVANRLRRLTASGRGVIELVAVAGQRVELRVLNTVEHSDEWLTEGLDEDVEARLLTEVGGLQPTYEFVHAIVRDTVEEMISPATRARLHLKLGRATETTYAADPRPVFALLARHFAGGAALGGATQALYYSRKAAEQAMRSAAYDEAISHLLVAFELSEPGSVEQVDVMLELGNAKSRLGLHRDAIATFGEAFRAARERGLVAQAALAAAGFDEAVQQPGLPGAPAVQIASEALQLLGEEDTPLRTRLQASLARALALTGRSDEALRIGDEAIAAARRQGDDSALMSALGSALVYSWEPRRYAAPTRRSWRRLPRVTTIPGRTWKRRAARSARC